MICGPLKRKMNSYVNWKMEFEILVSDDEFMEIMCLFTLKLSRIASPVRKKIFSFCND